MARAVEQMRRIGLLRQNQEICLEENLPSTELGSH